MSLLHKMTHEELDGMIKRRDAEIARLRADLAAQDAELVGLRDALRGADAALKRLADEQPRISAEQPRTDAEWRAADRKKRINDLAARGAFELYAARLVALDHAMHAQRISGPDAWDGLVEMRQGCVIDARALAAAVVDAEE